MLSQLCTHQNTARGSGYFKAGALWNTTNFAEPWWACLHYQTACRAQAFSESIPDIYHIHGQICNVCKAPKCWGWSNTMYIWTSYKQMSQAAGHAAENTCTLPLMQKGWSSKLGSKRSFSMWHECYQTVKYYKLGIFISSLNYPSHMAIVSFTISYRAAQRLNTIKPQRCAGFMQEAGSGDPNQHTLARQSGWAHRAAHNTLSHHLYLEDVTFS